MRNITSEYSQRRHSSLCRNTQQTIYLKLDGNRPSDRRSILWGFYTWKSFFNKLEWTFRILKILYLSVHQETACIFKQMGINGGLICRVRISFHNYSRKTGLHRNQKVLKDGKASLGPTDTSKCLLSLRVGTDSQYTLYSVSKDRSQCSRLGGLTNTTKKDFSRFLVSCDPKTYISSQNQWTCRHWLIKVLVRMELVA